MKDPRTGEPQTYEVLLVEDSRTHATIVTRMLRVSSPEAQQVFGRFHLTVRTSVAQAQEFLEDHRVDIVLADLNVTDSLGMGTLHAVRAAAPETPVVVLTGSSDEAVGMEAVAAGAESYLRKSEASPPLLIRTIHHAIERRRLTGKLERMAWYDEMTSLLNRRGFFRSAEEMHQGAAANEERVMAVFIDLNDLKVLNDTFGHEAGDQAIIAVADVLANATTSTGGVAGRLGGDEFCALVPAGDGPQPFLDAIAACLEDVNDHRGEPLSLSLGFFVGHAATGDLDEFMRIADNDLYAAKARKGTVDGPLIASR